MTDVMYQVPSDETIVSCTVTKDAVDGIAPPVVEHGEKREPVKQTQPRRTTGRRKGPESA